jgi:hypothetical protein
VRGKFQISLARMALPINIILKLGKSIVSQKGGKRRQESVNFGGEIGGPIDSDKS